MTKNIHAAPEKKKTTHSLPIAVLDRLRIQAAILKMDQQDVVAQLLDNHLPRFNFDESDSVA